MTDDKKFVLIPPGKLLCLSNEDGDSGEPSSAIIKCEIDGVPVAGVCFVSIEIDRDGDSCLMLFTEPVLIGHVKGQNAAQLRTDDDPQS